MPLRVGSWTLARSFADIVRSRNGGDRGSSCGHHYQIGPYRLVQLRGRSSRALDSQGDVLRSHRPNDRYVPVGEVLKPPMEGHIEPAGQDLAAQQSERSEAEGRCPDCLQTGRAQEGADVATISKMINDYMAGTLATEIQTGPKVVGIRVAMPYSQRDEDKKLGELYLRAADGHLFPLRRVATFVKVTGQPQITRESLQAYENEHPEARGKFVTNASR